MTGAHVTEKWSIDAPECDHFSALNLMFGYTGYISLPEELSRHLEAECSIAEEGMNHPAIQQSFYS